MLASNFPGSASFPPENRLHSSGDYRPFFQKGRRVRRLTHCRIYQVPNQRGHYRLGITVKVTPGAVVRNRIKRVVRETFRRFGSGLGSYDYNVVVPVEKQMDPQFSNWVRTELERELSREFKNGLCH